jgi:hypothetical protein
VDLEFLGGAIDPWGNQPEQLEILGLLEAVNSERSAMRAMRALAELMGHLHGLGERIAGELPGLDRDRQPARRW